MSTKPFFQKLYKHPTIVGWNRLESRCRTENFDRSLKAEIRDALWMLTRQWQMGEFKGEDAGSPIDARMLTVENKINRYAIKNGDAVAFDDSVPLEAKVERENIPDSLHLKIQISTYFFRLLSGIALVKTTAQTLLKSNPAYLITLPSDSEGQNMIKCNQGSSQLFEQASLRSIDGYKLISEIQSGAYDTWINSQTVNVISATEKTNLINAGKSLLAWFKRLYNQPTSIEKQAWSTPYLEYQFACSAPADSFNPALKDKQIILTAEQYATGHLDWYSFNLDKSKDKFTDKQNISNKQTSKKLKSFIPTEATFGGMPNPRYWEMEDSKTDFGGIDAHTTDVAKLIVAEFGLIYGNDWFIFPYRMDVGTICEIKGLIITDTFGDRTLINAAGNGSDDAWQKWRLFNMTVEGAGGEADMRLLLAPALTKVYESEPLEKVNLIRDEMANVVWGVENTITLPSGKAINGFEAAKELNSYLYGDSKETVTNLDAAVKYSLGTTVPENWIPFVSVLINDKKNNRQTQMQRASMPDVSSAIITKINPRTSLLSGDDPFYIHEEEVPKSGTIVTKTFQRTRWYNGKVVLWIGKKVSNGKREGNSGLKFDQIKSI